MRELSLPLPLDVRDLLDVLLLGMQQALHGEVIGVYLFGSVTLGAYDQGISDVDLLACTTRDPDEAMLERLKRIHDRVVDSRPQWRDRVEVVYAGADSLRTFRERPHRIARISPGEDLNLRQADADWLIDWYQVLDSGITLFGVEPETVLPLLSTDEFRHAAWKQMHGWPGRLRPGLDPGYLSYIVLALARGLHAVVNGQQVSKEAGGRWVASTWQEWSALTAAAVRCRIERHLDEPHALTTERVREFAHFALERAARALGE